MAIETPPPFPECAKHDIEDQGDFWECVYCGDRFYSAKHPIDGLQGSKPVVVYFDTEEDRQGFIDAMHEVKPGMIARELP